MLCQEETGRERYGVRTDGSTKIDAEQTKKMSAAEGTKQKKTGASENAPAGKKQGFAQPCVAKTFKVKAVSADKNRSGLRQAR
jgi:hypothetical protein